MAPVTLEEAREQILEEMRATDAKRAQLVDQLEQLASGEALERELVPPRILALAKFSQVAYYAAGVVLAIFMVAASVVQRHIERDHAAAENDVVLEPVVPATVAGNGRPLDVMAGRPVEGERL